MSTRVFEAFFLSFWLKTNFQFGIFLQKKFLSNDSLRRDFHKKTKKCKIVRNPKLKCIHVFKQKNILSFIGPCTHIHILSNCIYILSNHFNIAHISLSNISNTDKKPVLPIDTWLAHCILFLCNGHFNARCYGEGNAAGLSCLKHAPAREEAGPGSCEPAPQTSGPPPRCLAVPPSPSHGPTSLKASLAQLTRLLSAQHYQQSPIFNVYCVYCAQSPSLECTHFLIAVVCWDLAGSRVISRENHH